MQTVISDTDTQSLSNSISTASYQFAYFSQPNKFSQPAKLTPKNLTPRGNLTLSS